MNIEMGAGCSTKTNLESSDSKPCSCIDGREKNPIFGVPGGDSGLLLRVIYSYFLVTGKELTEEETKEFILEAHSMIGRPIYLHTDSHAAHHIDVTKETTNIEDLFIPQNIGCGYLKLSMHDPTKLGEEETTSLSKIARSVYSNICEISWTGKQVINVVVLEGNHVEDAVQVSKSTTKPLEPKGHVFVYHPNKEKMMA
eukprot:gnl/Chilomastix_caulleri/3332.p1 GENE.gnl/Chilomastix_caulleri/3332~~gnl/Chilomastix_caulleri/3332.p1  ORF type:complete len:198 (+),score=24.53 gnl/Chilomastix_caulleri/3332:147-740(+)